MSNKFRPYIGSHERKEIKFLLKIINTWMVADVLRMRNLKIIPGSGGNCNFPIVLYIFACMDFLGYLVAEEKLNYGKGSTKKKIWSYMRLTFAENMKNFEEHEPYFIDIFRNGLSHQYFAKGAGISRGGRHVLCIGPRAGLVLDADKFADIFVKSTKIFRNLFFKKNYLIQFPELSNRVYERFTELMQKGLPQHARQISV